MSYCPKCFFCLGYHGSSPTAVQAWRPCPLWEPYPSHPILVLTRGFAVFLCFYVCLLCFCYLCTLFVPSVLWYCWLRLLTCKNSRPYNLYCVGRDFKPCSISQKCFGLVSQKTCSFCIFSWTSGTIGENGFCMYHCLCCQAITRDWVYTVLLHHVCCS